MNLSDRAQLAALHQREAHASFAVEDFTSSAHTSIFGADLVAPSVTLEVILFGLRLRLKDGNAFAVVFIEAHAGSAHDVTLTLAAIFIDGPELALTTLSWDKSAKGLGWLRRFTSIKSFDLFDVTALAGRTARVELLTVRARCSTSGDS